MKKNIINFAIIVCIASMYSCSETTFSSTEITIGNSDSSIELKDCFSSAKIIPLKENAETPMADISIMKYHEGKFYCTDTHATAIWVFDKEGNQTAYFEHLGHSGGEYTKILDFDIVGEELWMLCSPAKIMRVGLASEQISILPLDEATTMNRICHYDGLTYLYEEAERAVYTIDGQGETSRLFSQVPLPMASKEMPMFYPCKDCLLYTAAGVEDIYKIDKGNITRYITVDYEGKENAIERFAEAKVPTFEERMKLSFMDIKNIFDLGDQYMISYVFKMIYRACFIDKESGNLLNDGIQLGFFGIPILEANDRIYGVGFYSKENPLVDENQIPVSVVNQQNIPEDGCNAIIEYEL